MFHLKEKKKGKKELVFNMWLKLRIHQAPKND